MIEFDSGKVIAVSGVVGAGKTTFIEAMAGGLTIPAFYENVQGNPLLPLMYSEPKRWALTLQMNFLREKFVQMVSARKLGNCLVERTIFEDIIFTGNHKAEGNLLDIEWDVYKAMYDHFTEQAPKPDLMIFLDVSDELALQRIKQRGRDYEQGDEMAEYFIRVNQVYRQWIEDYKYPKLIVDNGGFDYIYNVEHKRQMTNVLTNFFETGVY